MKVSLFLIVVLFAILSLDCFSQGTAPASEDLDLAGTTQKTPLRSSGPVGDFVKGSYFNLTDMVKLDFFDYADDVHIQVLNELGNVVFDETVDVSPTYTRYIDLSAFGDGYYEIKMDNSAGISIYGSFFLE